MISQLVRLLVGHEHELVCEDETSGLNIVFLGCGFVYFLEVNDERGLDSKDSVRGLVWIATYVKRSDYRLAYGDQQKISRWI